MTTVPKSDWRQWRGNLFVACPKCQRTFRLNLDRHAVDPDGVLDRPVKCPNDDCGLDDLARLEDWRTP